MDKREIERRLTKLTPQIFCKFCVKNIKREEIGIHYRSEAHKINLEKSRETGTYEDLLELYEIHILVQQFIVNEKERK